MAKRSNKTTSIKNYIYFAIAFSLRVEMLNITTMKRERKRHLAQLKEPVLEEKQEVYDDLARQVFLFLLYAANNL